MKKFGITKITLQAVALATSSLLITMSAAQAEWTIDLSRRTQQMRRSEFNSQSSSESSGRGSSESSGRGPASVRTFEGDEPASLEKRANEETTFIDKVFEVGEPSQDIVILNTERGFVPNTIRVRKDGKYTVHVVNVNEKEKNVSFILDGFSEHHATFFGKVKTFKLEPRKEGVYSFLSPETAVEGKFIVFANGPEAGPKLRVPATAQLNPADGASQGVRVIGE